MPQNEIALSSQSPIISAIHYVELLGLLTRFNLALGWRLKILPWGALHCQRVGTYKNDRRAWCSGNLWEKRDAID